MKIYKHVIWDWNGTLLDDVGIVIDSMNRLLKRRDLPLLDYKTYKDLFVFPVKDYYAKLGFNFEVESFEMLAAEYIAEVNSIKHRYKLFPEAKKVLCHIYDMGISQSILSASKEEELNSLVERLGIRKYFLNVVGLNNHYASCKIERGRESFSELNLRSEVILIGDTIHDYEVAYALGCDCLLISNGHQSYGRLNHVHTNIGGSLLDVIQTL